MLRTLDSAGTPHSLFLSISTGVGIVTVSPRRYSIRSTYSPIDILLL